MFGCQLQKATVAGSQNDEVAVFRLPGATDGGARLGMADCICAARALSIKASGLGPPDQTDAGMMKLDPQLELCFNTVLAVVVGARACGIAPLDSERPSSS